MALLTSCWFIIESIIIPDGFVKWFYLSFYIHPFFLLLCQLFLWLKLLNRGILVVIFFLVRIICFMSLCVFRFFRNCAIYIFSFSRVPSVEVTEEAEKSLVVQQSYSRTEVGNSYSFSSITLAPCKLILYEFRKSGLVEEIKFEEHVVRQDEEEIMEEPSSCPSKDPGLSEHISSFICLSDTCTEDVDSHEESDSSTVCSSNSPSENLDMNESAPSALCISSSTMTERGVADQGDHEPEEDAFYKKYTERMGWFDLLNYDRTCGISAVANHRSGSTPSSFESNEPADFMSTPYKSWSKQTEKRLLRSLETDFETVYVAQSCLSWEALHNQYTKVKALADSSSQNDVFNGKVVGEFQNFQVLLERFLEDERCEGKRIWNYVRRRFALKSLLQVPQISGLVEDEKEDGRGEAVSVNEVLKAIERCMNAHGIFIRTENKKPAWWKLKNSLLWYHPPVEDPRDLKLLHHLTKQIHVKELRLKDVQGKQRCWFKRVVNLVEESQRKEIFWAMIDMKLVSRVLQMATVSSSQLKWCQEKLDNIEFKEGKVFRACTSPLFPP